MAVRGVPRLRFTRFLTFGDSLTFGAVSQAPSILAFIGGPDSYPFKLQSLLAGRYATQSIVMENSGVGAELASVGGQARLPTELSTHQPEVLLLMEGTNDLFVYLEAGVPIGIAALDRMVTEARNRGVRVMLATIPPQRAGGVRNRDRVAAIIPGFNDEVRALAARHSVPVVDVFSAIQPDLQHLIGVDDLHPTPQGYDVITKTFFDAIRVNFEMMSAEQSHAR